jgi:hypothetical protein
MSAASPVPNRRKPESFPPYSRTVEMINMARGGVVFDAEMAREVAEALFEHHYGSDELKRQLPLIIKDKDDYWRIEGSWNRDFRIDDNGALFLSIHKYDGRVFDLGQWGPMLFRGTLDELLAAARQPPPDGE